MTTREKMTEEQAKSQYDFVMSEINHFGSDATESMYNKADFFHNEWNRLITEREQSEKTELGKEIVFFEKC